MATKFCTVAPNICTVSVQNLLHVTLLAPEILKVALGFWEMCANLEYGDFGRKYTPGLIITQFRAPSRFYA